MLKSDEPRLLSTEQDRERFWSKVSKHEGCWLWTGGREGSGYGVFWFNYGNHKAHRFAYALSGHSIPPGYVLDHTCGNKLCVNPRHLDLVTPEENSRRGTPGRKRVSHCIAGHSFDEENTYTDPRGRRHCKECRRRRMRESGRRRRAREKSLRSGSE